MQRIDNVTIKTDYQAKENGERLFWIGESATDETHAPLVLNLDGARMLLQAMWDDPEGVFDRLTEFVDREEDAIRAANHPDRTIEYDGTTYGLFRDGSIKSRFERDGAHHWRKVAGRMAEILTAESFDDPESLNVPVKIVKASRSSATVDALAAMQAKLDAQAAQNAQLQAMMMQFLQSQTASK